MGNFSLNLDDRADKDWWTRDRDPLPKPERNAEQIGVRRRTVERCLEGLQGKRLVKRRGPCRIDSGRVIWPTGPTRLAASLEQITGILVRRVRKGVS